MRRRRFLAGLARVPFDRLDAFVQPAKPPLQRIDFLPLPDDRFVQFLDRPFLMAQPDFEFGDAGFRVGSGFFSGSGHERFPW